jgi:hypothetical protein
VIFRRPSNDCYGNESAPFRRNHIASTREAKCASTRLILKEGSRNMSSRFFYVQLRFIPKSGLKELPMRKQHGAVVEVSKDRVQHKRSEIINENRSDKAIALDLARRAALGTFPTVEERVVGLYHEDAIWYENRPPVMNERPCDNEENGTRAWRIVLGSRPERA